jgi:hypothetical protein
MKTAKLGVVIGGLACVACCAVPLAAIFGVGAAVSGAAAWFEGWDAETVFCVATFGAIGIATLYFAIRKARVKRECATSCEVNASCCAQKPNS